MTNNFSGLVSGRRRGILARRSPNRSKTASSAYSTEIQPRLKRKTRTFVLVAIPASYPPILGFVMRFYAIGCISHLTSFLSSPNRSSFPLDFSNAKKNYAILEVKTPGVSLGICLSPFRGIPFVKFEFLTDGTGTRSVHSALSAICRLDWNLN